jgi:hypothetical protein
MNNRQEFHRGDTQSRRVPQYDRHRDYEQEREENRRDYETQNDANWRNSEDYGRGELDDRNRFQRDFRPRNEQHFDREYSIRENYRGHRPDNDEPYQSRWFNGGSNPNMQHGFNQQNYDQRGYGRQDIDAGMNDYFPRNGGKAEQPRNEFGQFASTRGQFAGRGPKGYRRSDDRITEDVNEALSQDPDLDASDLEVKVESGAVTLTGTVTERQFKRMAEDIAEACSGVSDVHNQIRVARHDDQEAQGRAKTAAQPGNQKASESKTTHH